jgi:AraC-like DNA-binding protein
MIKKFTPEINKIYLIQTHTMYHILEGMGNIEVDFNAYHDWDDKLIFLEKGQYIKFTSGNFIVRKIEFESKQVFHSKEVRVLFKHLVSLGYINFDECEDCKTFLNQTAFSENASDIIDISSNQWYWQNPFHAKKDEYHVIFDVKDIIDENFKSNLTNDQLIKMLGSSRYRAQSIFKSKVGLTVKSLYTLKRLSESKKDIALTDKNINEIAYEYGFVDPAYFNRIFKNSSGLSPSEFRKKINFEERDSFSPKLFELLKNYHAEERSVSFYAESMNLSPKTLSKKVKTQLNTTIGQLIRNEIINSAKLMLLDGWTIKEVAYELAFEEANHFSSFFKKYTNTTPSDYIANNFKGI